MVVVKVWGDEDIYALRCDTILEENNHPYINSFYIFSEAIKLFDRI